MNAFGKNSRGVMSDVVNTTAICWYIKLSDSRVMGFTDHDVDIQIDGVTYIAKSGIRTTAATSSVDFGANNMEIEGVLTHDVLDELDILSGLYDNAMVEVTLVDYIRNEKCKVICKGVIGEIRMTNNRFIAEVRGMTELLDVNAMSNYSTVCRANFCDKKCKLSINSVTYQECSVSNVISLSKFESADFGNIWLEVIGEERKLIPYGYLRFTTGANKFRKLGISHVIGERIELESPLLRAISLHDKFTISLGCDKEFSTCTEIFDNAINFRGEPDINKIKLDS